MHATPGDIKSLRSSADRIADMLSDFADMTSGLRKACLKRSILSFFNIKCTPFAEDQPASGKIDRHYRR